MTIVRARSGYVATCPALDVASQGDSISEARDNTKAALDLFLESATPDEIYVTQVEVTVTRGASAFGLADLPETRCNHSSFAGSP